ncbi:MAG TPA: GDP-mannose 4,6-dehydratase, partial [Spirochaetota bacterium]|nr:GDP-mannose 4,6-dehydratase [Spirochaetota bacterium]
MSILVCGGAGYIGSHTVYELVAKGENVVVADNLQKGHRSAVHPDAELCVGDLRDRDFLRDLFRKHDISAVIDFAAESLVGESVVNPLKYYNNNMGGTISLLEAMNEAGVKM